MSRGVALLAVVAIPVVASASTRVRSLADMWPAAQTGAAASGASYVGSLACRRCHAAITTC